ncbi:hypothetical protein LCI18_000600 [Fusarium solani-melongenae]|uniref:Uncharacterized protein n=1 Tax=Fusarium solani subsp. cucurbitae TaxID=2747967 RepID=A0ACD3YLB8_FUSSC|nr:hypothetical protein LCI18_000600 [Fusarium solani-melongenae]
MYLSPLLIFLASAVGTSIPTESSTRNAPPYGPVNAAQHAEHAPVVYIPRGIVLGKLDNRTETFNGIPYAKAPTGNLRLRPPVRFTGNLGVFNATVPAVACPQPVPNGDPNPLEESGLASLLGDLPLGGDSSFPQSEDCLTATVTRPRGITKHDKLPVVFWIFGGGFEVGYSAMDDGTTLFEFGVDIGMPFIFVAVNYRVSNLGLLDQRLGLEWVADNIRFFGGDPGKVTTWGQSAGSMSVYLQTALYGGDHRHSLTGRPLFRAAFMSSGAILPADPVDSDKAKKTYNEVVGVAGCAGSEDSLQCLREVDLETFTKAVSAPPQLVSYTSIALTFLPRPDGIVLPSSPDRLAAEGRVAPVPVIAGHAEDEANLFALFPANVTTVPDLAEYLQSFYYPAATKEQLTDFILTYGDGKEAIINGSPFRTGLGNEILPGFKRQAALMGDTYFSLSRRLYLDYLSSTRSDIPTWSFIASLADGTPILGSYHGVDIASAFLGAPLTFGARAFQTYLLNFVHNLDPNEGSNVQRPAWRRWKEEHQELQLFSNRTELLDDNFRLDSFNWMAENIGLWNL